MFILPYLQGKNKYINQKNMQTIKIIETGEEKTLSNNEAFGLVDKGLADYVAKETAVNTKIVKEYKDTQLKKYNNKGYGISNTSKHKNVSRNKRQHKRHFNKSINRSSK